MKRIISNFKRWLEFKSRHKVRGSVVYVQTTGKKSEGYLIDTGRLPKDIAKTLSKVAKLEVQELLYKVIKVARITKSGTLYPPAGFVQLNIV